MNNTVHMIPMLRKEKRIVEISRQRVEWTQSVPSAPSSTKANQPKGPTYMTTRMGMGKESSMFVKVPLVMKVVKKIPAPPSAYATSVSQNEAFIWMRCSSIYFD